MDLIETLGLGFIGFMIGTLAVSRVGQWFVDLHSIANDQDKSYKTSRFVMAALFSSGPWVLVAAGVFGYFIQSKPWAVPIFIGAVVAVGSFGLLIAYLAWRDRRSKPHAT